MEKPREFVPCWRVTKEPALATFPPEYCTVGNMCPHCVEIKRLRQVEKDAVPDMLRLDALLYVGVEVECNRFVDTRAEVDEWMEERDEQSPPE